VMRILTNLGVLERTLSRLEFSPFPPSHRRHSVFEMMGTCHQGHRLEPFRGACLLSGVLCKSVRRVAKPSRHALQGKLEGLVSGLK
jgi:hypothetical protein